MAARRAALMSPMRFVRIAFSSFHRWRTFDFSAARRLFLILFLSIGTRVPILLAGPTTVEDWPRFLGPHTNNTSLETGLLDKWPSSGPPEIWSKQIGTGYSAPSVSGDDLVLHHRIKDEEIVECFDAGTAKSKWRYAYPSHFVDPYGYNNGPRGTPLLTSNRCYTFGAEGKLLCLDRNGRLIWQHDTDRDW